MKKLAVECKDLFSYVIVVNRYEFDDILKFAMNLRAPVSSCNLNTNCKNKEHIQNHLVSCSNMTSTRILIEYQFRGPLVAKA